MTFHLWCSSNSLMDDSIWLHFFQRTLTGSMTKWYIELQRKTFQYFNSLAMDFLTHFQLPIHYETNKFFFTSLHQTNSVHISDHIHEWRWWQWLIKATIPDQLLVEWFTECLLPPIARDVPMGGVVIEEEAQPPTTGKKPQCKPKFPCLIYGEDHYTWYYPHRDKVT